MTSNKDKSQKISLVFLLTVFCLCTTSAGIDIDENADDDHHENYKL